VAWEGCAVMRCNVMQNTTTHYHAKQRSATSNRFACLGRLVLFTCAREPILYVRRVKFLVQIGVHMHAPSLFVFLSDTHTHTSTFAVRFPVTTCVHTHVFSPLSLCLSVSLSLSPHTHTRTHTHTHTHTHMSTGNDASENNR